MRTAANREPALFFSGVFALVVLVVGPMWLARPYEEPEERELNKRGRKRRGHQMHPMMAQSEAHPVRRTYRWLMPHETTVNYDN